MFWSLDMAQDFSDRKLRDHLRKHIHLTNCIHVKNHMHKQGRILADRALMRDLAVLQKSRSLKDPNATPLSRHSPSVVDMLLTRVDRDALVSGTQSLCAEHPRECPRKSKRSHRATGLPVTKAAKAGKCNGSKNWIHHGGRVKRGESSRWFPENNVLCCKDSHPEDEVDLVNYIVFGHSELRNRGVKKKGAHRRDRILTVRSNQLKGIPSVSDHVELSCNNGRISRVKKITGEVEKDSHSHGNDVNRAKRCKFRGTRRHRPPIPSLDAEAQNEMSVASNSLSQGRDFQGYHLMEGVLPQEDSNQKITSVPVKGFGSPSNWSRIHHCGKPYLDKAGLSLSCGLCEPQLRRREGTIAQRRVISDTSAMSEYSSSYTKSDAEALPLLLDASGSQGSSNHSARVHAYLEELGISVDELLRKEIDSDLASEGVSSQQHKFQRQLTYRHQNLTQKYMPKTFRDLVGQNLVAQALSNAIMKRKVGSLYVFYGPHGTGKTTCARIFARALNCQSPESPKPCGLCDYCIADDGGKSRNVMEISPVRNLDFDVFELFRSMIATRHHSHYRIFILDDCDTLSTDCWSAILKAIDQAPRQVVFILVCSSIDVLPHVLMSRCQKFYFPKLKDTDIIQTLQCIAAKEDLEIDKDALKLIALRSDGSLRDAEMTLEQLSLLGQRISLCLVQELVGLISDEKLVDLLDLALTADTVNTVKNLRDIMESGIEPLVLMSQLATVITDILAGSYDILKERRGRKFFRHQTLSKEDMEKLRQALKTLSEAEKQLRLSNDRITWLTAAVLQLAPDQNCTRPSSTTYTSLNRNTNQMKEPQLPHNLEEIWLEVLEKIPVRSIKEFMHQEGKLISVGQGAVPAVQLLFNTQLTKSKAEKFRSHILQAFESVLKSPVAIDIKCESTEAKTMPKLSPAASDKLNTKSTSLREKPTQEKSTMDQRKAEGDRNPSLSLVRSKVSLAHVILQHTEGYTQHRGWLKHKAFSIAQKLEQQNMKLESRSRTLLCWNPPIRLSSRKISRLKIGARRPQMLLKSVCYGRCLSGTSPSPR